MNKQVFGCSLLVGISILFLFGYSAFGFIDMKHKTSSSIRGSIKGLPNGSRVNLHYDIAGQEKKETGFSTGESFRFDVDVPYPSVARIDFDYQVSHSVFDFVLEKGNISLAGDLGKFRPAVLSGTISNDAINSFYTEAEVKQMLNEVEKLEAAQAKLERARANPDKIETVAMQCLEKLDQLGNRSYKYIKEHPGSYASVFLVSEYMALNATAEVIVWITCKNLDKELLLHSKAGMRINEKLVALKKSGKYK